MTGTGSEPQTRKEIFEALGSYQRQAAVSITGKELSDMLVNESDRGVVVFMTSILEDILLTRLMSKFVELKPAERKNLTRSGGLLANLDDRINLAHAMGLLSQDSVEMLQVFKAMRNACAHSRKKMTFKTPALRGALSLLFDGEGALDIRDNVSDPMVLRITFLSAFVFLNEMIFGGSTEQAQQATQRIIDGLMVEIEKAQQKTSRGKRTKQPAKRLPKPPIS